MEHLQQLIKGLSKSEKKMVRKFLAAYSSNGKSKTLSLELFDLLNKRTKKLSNKECSEILFGQDEKNRMRVLKSRLKNRILDALTTNIVVQNQEVDVVSKQSILLRKKIIEFKTLFVSKKASTEFLNKMLNEVIEKATKYELYPLLMEAYGSKRVLIGYRQGVESFSDFETKVENATRDQMNFNRLVNSYYHLLLLYRSNPTKKDIKNFLRETIKKGDQILKETPTTIGEYYLNVIKYAYFIDINNLEKANEIMQNQLVLLESSKAAYRLSRLGATYDYLCQVNIKLQKYKLAANYAAKGKECFKKGELNYAVAEELEFRAYLYDGNYTKAESCIKSMRRNYKDSVDAHRLSTHKFFLANLHFAKGEYKKCNRLLAEDFEFKKDKTGWEFNLKLLGIMCLIEQNKNDDAFTKHYNLNRLLTKYKKEDQKLSSRNQIIMKLLKTWVESGGNKTMVKLKDSPALKNLSSPKNEWDPLGSELIPFDKWFKKKI